MTGRLWLAIGVALCAFVSSARAATHDVATTAQFRFAPDPVTISQGDTVTWTNPGGGFHNVRFDDGFAMPATPSNMWTAPVSRTFDQPGTFTYYCAAHKGAGMTGTITVDASPSGAPGGGSGGGSGGVPPAPPPDTVPVSALVSPSRQDVDRLYVKASMNELGTLVASATVSAPGGARLYRFRRVSRAVAANVTVKLPLRLAKKPRRAVKRALRRGKRLSARITLVARDTTGHEAVRRQKVRLRP